MKKLALTLVVAIWSIAAVQSASAQFPGTFGGGFRGIGGFSPYSGFGPYAGFGPFGGFGYGSNGGFGYGPGGFGGFGGGFGLGGGYGGFQFSQGLYQQQAALTQQIYAQQQLALVGQIRERQATADGLDATRQQLFQQYLNLSDSDKAVVRAGLMSDYLSLDPRGRAAWQRDAVVEIILGKDLQRLEAAAQVPEMDPADQSRLRASLREKFRSLAAADQRAWQKDPVITRILGKDWWLK